MHKNKKFIKENLENQRKTTKIIVEENEINKEANQCKNIIRNKKILFNILIKDIGNLFNDWSGIDFQKEEILSLENHLCSFWYQYSDKKGMSKAFMLNISRKDTKLSISGLAQKLNKENADIWKNENHTQKIEKKLYWFQEQFDRFFKKLKKELDKLNTKKQKYWNLAMSGKFTSQEQEKAISECINKVITPLEDGYLKAYNAFYRFQYKNNLLFLLAFEKKKALIEELKKDLELR